MQRIQAGQGKALEKYQSETEYPQRIKALVDDLRVSQNHCRELEERLRVE